MSQVFDDLYNQVQDLQTASDNNQPVIDSMSQAVQPDGSVRAQLDFPLDDQSAQEIKQLFPTGTATLAAGTVTVTDGNVQASSIIIISRATAGGTLGHLSIASQQAGSFVINSSSATDTSLINYVIFN